jgi:hypothetical protein
VDAAYSAAFLTAAVGMALESDDLPDDEDPGITITRCVSAMVLDACIYEMPALGSALSDALVAALLSVQSALRHDIQKRDKAGWTAASGVVDALQRGGAVALDKTQALTPGPDMLGNKRLQFFRACALVRCLPHQFLAAPRSLALREQLQQCGLLLVALQLRYSTCEDAFAHVCKSLAALTQALTRVLRGTAVDATVSKQTADVRWVLSCMQTALQLVGGRSDAGAAPLFLDCVASAAVWVAELLVSTEPELGSQVFVDLAAFLTDDAGQVGKDPADTMRALCRASVGHHVLGALSASGLPAPARTLQAVQRHAVQVLSLAGSGSDGQSHALLEHSCGIVAATVEMCPSESTTDEDMVAALGLASKCLMGGGGRHTARALCASLRVLHTRGCLTARMCENSLHAMMCALTGTLREPQPVTKAAVLDAAATLVDLADSGTRSAMVEFLLTSSDDALVAGTGAAGPLQLLRVLLMVQCRSRDAGSSGGTDYGDSCAAIAIRALDGLAFEGSSVDIIDAQATAAVRSLGMCELAPPTALTARFLSVFVQLGVLTVLLSTRRQFQLRSARIAQALAAPDVIMAGSCPPPPSSAAFLAACELLQTALRSRFVHSFALSEMRAL